MRPMMISLATCALALTGCGSAPAIFDDQASGVMAGFSTNSAPLTLFTEPTDGTAPVVNAITSARSQIKMEMYILTSQAVIGALTDAARKGVDVRVMLEQHPYSGSGGGGGSSMNQPAFDTLQSAGVKVTWSNPHFKYTHEKAIVIDGKTVLIMTTNMSKGAFTNNREYGLVDNNPQDVQAVGAIFDADWQKTQPVYDDPNLVVSPDNSRNKLTNLIDSARRSLVIEDEELNDPQVAQALGRKVKSGVKVQVLLAGPTQGSANSGLQSEITLLKTAGVTQIKSFSQHYLHAKLIIMDDTSAYLGSVNLSANSMDNNREVGLIFNDQGIISQVGKTAAADWAAGTAQ